MVITLINSRLGGVHNGEDSIKNARKQISDPLTNITKTGSG